MKRDGRKGGTGERKRDRHRHRGRERHINRQPDRDRWNRYIEREDTEAESEVWTEGETGTDGRVNWSSALLVVR